jgi:hypothetical protein
MSAANVSYTPENGKYDAVYNGMNQAWAAAEHE